jgi:hypothetical protein
VDEEKNRGEEGMGTGYACIGTAIIVGRKVRAGGFVQTGFSRGAERAEVMWAFSHVYMRV